MHAVSGVCIGSIRKAIPICSAHGFEGMTPAVLEKIKEAKESGEWDAAIVRKDVSSVPDDLVQALDENDAWEAFENWPASQKQQYLYWLESAKRPETRQKRLHAIVEKAERHRYPRRK